MKRMWYTPTINLLNICSTKNGRDAAYKEYSDKTKDPYYGNPYHPHTLKEPCQYGNGNTNGFVNS